MKREQENKGTKCNHDWELKSLFEDFRDLAFGTPWEAGSNYICRKCGEHR